MQDQENVELEMNTSTVEPNSVPSVANFINTMIYHCQWKPENCTNRNPIFLCRLLPQSY